MKPFHFLLAPDSFKGALSATQACVAMERGIRRAFSAAASTRAPEITAIPLADGGEGTVEAFQRGAGGTLQATRVKNPLGETVDAKWLLLDGRAVLEMAQSSGLNLVPENRRDALRASSFGLGETMRAALDLGCRELLIGVGGSATTDGGAGALQALGARFLNERGDELPTGGAALSQLARVDLSNFDARLQGAKIQVLCDVTNPLLGENGAARIFAPQKGASPRDVETLESALSHFADIAAAAPDDASTRDDKNTRRENAAPDKNVSRAENAASAEKLPRGENASRDEKSERRESTMPDRTATLAENAVRNENAARSENAPSYKNATLSENATHRKSRASTRDDASRDLRDAPGAGAAGGAAFGLMRFCGATLTPGIDAVLEATRFAEKLRAADLVFTGEGSIDLQTPHGKALSGVARAAKNANVPVVAFGGRVQLSGEELRDMGIAAAFPIGDGPLSLEESIARASELLENAAQRVAALWLAARENRKIEN